MGATTLNSYWERETDKFMERTQNRPLPAGRLAPWVALLQGCLLLLVSIPLLMVAVNVLTGMLVLLAVILYLALYTPLKKWGTIALYVGSISGAAPPLLGQTALTGEVGAVAWFLFALMVLWQLPHFLAISLYCADDYRAAEIVVYPNLKGVRTTKRLLFFFTLFLFWCSLFPYFFMGAEKNVRVCGTDSGRSFLIFLRARFCVPRMRNGFGLRRERRFGFPFSTSPWCCAVLFF